MKIRTIALVALLAGGVSLGCSHKPGNKRRGAMVERLPQVEVAQPERKRLVRRLELAGATRALSAYHAGALRMAASVLRSSVVEFIELSTRGEDVALEEIRIAPASALAGTAIAALEGAHARTRVVGLKRGEEPLRMVPDAGEQVTAGDLLVVIGPRQSLERLAQAAV